MKLILVLFVITAACFVSCQRDRPMILCGRQLANARVILCYGEGYVMKRGDGNSLLENLAEGKGDELDSPWTGRHGALAAGWSSTKYKRDELGLVDQCCLRPCTKEVILDYC